MSNKAFMIPKNHEYIKRLSSSLKEKKVNVVILKPFHYSTLSNLIKIVFFRMRGYNIMHVHWLYIFPFSFVMKCFYYLCFALGIKIIWEIHNIVPHNFKKRDIEDSKWFYKKSNAIIFHSKNDVSRAKKVLSVDIDKMHIVIPHGNFNESYANSISKEEARKKLNIPDGKKVILCFGFLRKNRGYEYLIEATKDMNDVVVIVAGKILEKDVYRKLLSYKKKSNLKLYAGWIPNDDIQIYFNACDVVVLPYIDITTSGVIPLAYAFSKPVITSRIGGLNDIVNENTGILVPPRDSKALKNAIRKLLEMDYKAMGRYAYEYAKKEFNWNESAQEIKKLYSLVVK